MVVTESCLTGESFPVLKTPLPDTDFLSFALPGDDSKQQKQRPGLNLEQVRYSSRFHYYAFLPSFPSALFLVFICPHRTKHRDTSACFVRPCSARTSIILASLRVCRARRVGLQRCVFDGFFLGDSSTRLWRVVMKDLLSLSLNLFNRNGVDVRTSGNCRVHSEESRHDMLVFLTMLQLAFPNLLEAATTALLRRMSIVMEMCCDFT